MSAVYFHRWGFKVGGLAVTWMDAWKKRIGLEIVWRDRLLIEIGF